MQGRSFKIAHLLARFDHIASFVVNANYSGWELMKNFA
jgi:hypothetical protein